jgi:hypothetical protein
MKIRQSCLLDQNERRNHPSPFFTNNTVLTFGVLGL